MWCDATFSQVWGLFEQVLDILSNPIKIKLACFYVCIERTGNITPSSQIFNETNTCVRQPNWKHTFGECLKIAWVMNVLLVYLWAASMVTWTGCFCYHFWLSWISEPVRLAFVYILTNFMILPLPCEIRCVGRSPLASEAPGVEKFYTMQD